MDGIRIEFSEIAAKLNYTQEKDNGIISAADLCGLVTKSAKNVRTPPLDFH